MRMKLERISFRKDISGVCVSLLMLMKGRKLLEMPQVSKISATKRASVLLYRSEYGLSYRKIAKEFGISKSEAERICNSKKRTKKVMSKQGRPRKIEGRSLRVLLRTLTKLRETNVNFTVEELTQKSGLGNIASRRTFPRVLNENGYKFLQTRKKGLLSRKDNNVRVTYARKMSRVSANFWTRDVAFYLDGVSFVHKHNPKRKVYQPKG